MDFEALYGQLDRARREGDPSWHLRWRVGHGVYTALVYAVLPSGLPLLRPPQTVNDVPRLFGWPIVEDPTALTMHIEIEALYEGLWIMPLQATREFIGNTISATYPISPLQDRLVSDLPGRAPYADVDGHCVYTVLSKVPVGALVIADALPHLRDGATECLVMPPHAPPVEPLTAEPSPYGPRVEPWRFRAELYRHGLRKMILWRRLS